MLTRQLCRGGRCRWWFRFSSLSCVLLVWGIAQPIPEGSTVPAAVGIEGSRFVKKNARLVALTALTNFSSTVFFGVFINKLSDVASYWWVLTMGALALGLQVSIMIRNRPRHAPVVAFTNYVAAGVALAGMIFSTVRSPAAQRTGAIAAMVGLLILGLVAQGLDQTTRRATILSLLFIGVSTVVSGVQAHDQPSRRFLLYFGLALLAAGLVIVRGEPSQRVLAHLIIVLTLALQLPSTPLAPPAAPALIIACGAMLYWARGSETTSLVLAFGISAAALAAVFVKTNPLGINLALLVMAAASVLWTFATRRGGAATSALALAMFGVAMGAVGVQMAVLTSLGLCGAYLAMAIAVILHAVLGRASQLPRLRDQLYHFWRGAEPAATGQSDKPDAPSPVL